MSNAEIQRFAADLKSDAILRADAEKHAKASQSPFEEVADFAGSKGYSFTGDDLKQTASPIGKPLSEGELENIAGGNLLSLWKHPLLMPLGVLLGIKP